MARPCVGATDRFWSLAMRTVRKEARADMKRSEDQKMMAGAVKRMVLAIIENNTSLHKKLDKAVKSLTDLRYGIFKDAAAVNQLLDETLAELQK